MLFCLLPLREDRVAFHLLGSFPLCLAAIHFFSQDPVVPGKQPAVLGVTPFSSHSAHVGPTVLRCWFQACCTLLLRTRLSFICLSISKAWEPIESALFE